ncbi:hypothetical protein QOZ88_23065, partial [Blastococcus sp. BMG 814]|nr:hypothetical protein [Blastococcus carthaginiensis]
RPRGGPAGAGARPPATGPRESDPGPQARPAPRAAVVAQLRATLPPGTAGRISGRLPGSGRPPEAEGGVDLVAVSGYDPGDRLDGWYDALLATVSGGADGVATAARAVSRALSGLPGAGVPHDGAEVCAVLGRLAEGRAFPAT